MEHGITGVCAAYSRSETNLLKGGMVKRDHHSSDSYAASFGTFNVSEVENQTEGPLQFLVGLRGVRNWNLAISGQPCPQFPTKFPSFLTFLLYLNTFDGPL